MTNKIRKMLTCALSAALIVAFGAQAQFSVGEAAPDIKAIDINGKVVDLATVLEEKPDLAVVFFFTVERGEAIALKLQVLSQLTAGLEVLALGMEENQAALKQFATNLGIEYYVIPGDQVQDTALKSKLEVLPVTLFLMTQEKKIDKVIVGGTATQAKLLSYAAENYLRQKKLDEASKIAVAAVEAEEGTEARSTKAFIDLAQGKLDEAAGEFGAIDSKAGLAKVELERGNYDKAIELAKQDTTGYGAAVEGQALMHKGDMTQAAQVLTAAFDKDIPVWQRSEAMNAHGRAQHALGNTDAALGGYRDAVALDHYNVVALSNEGAALRDSGDLEGAQAVLTRAQNIREDGLMSAMLGQIQRELQRANDIELAKLVDKQIEDLAARIKEMKDNPDALAAQDSWSTRPLVMAFLPASYSPVFFERAGTDTVLQRELEAKLQSAGDVSVVEREMLDKLLQELNLGSSDLTDPTTQRSLGKVLSAGILGFIEFAEAGNTKKMYLRLIDVETSQIAGIISYDVDEKNPLDVVDKVAAEVTEKLGDNSELRGLIAEAETDDAIIINLGSKHGVEEGQAFVVLQSGDPIKVGNREIARRMVPIGTVIVTTLEDEFAICKVGQRKEGAIFAKEMRIKAAP